jgi:hypothetical protein
MFLPKGVGRGVDYEDMIAWLEEFNDSIAGLVQMATEASLSTRLLRRGIVLNVLGDLLGLVLRRRHGNGDCANVEEDPLEELVHVDDCLCCSLFIGCYSRSILHFGRRRHIFRGY